MSAHAKADPGATHDRLAQLDHEAADIHYEMREHYQRLAVLQQSLAANARARSLWLETDPDIRDAN